MNPSPHICALCRRECPPDRSVCEKCIPREEPRHNRVARAVGNAVFLDGGGGWQWGTASRESAEFQARAINEAVESAFLAGKTVGQEPAQ